MEKGRGERNYSMMDKWWDGKGIGKKDGISVKALNFESRPF
jgi:hypothetical protein